MHESDSTKMLQEKFWKRMWSDEYVISKEWLWSKNMMLQIRSIRDGISKQHDNMLSHSNTFSK